MPTGKEKTSLIEEEKEVQITEEGVVIEEEKSKETKKESKDKQPKSPYTLTILGIIGLCYGWSYAVKDAIKTAKKLNENVLKDL